MTHGRQRSPDHQPCARPFREVDRARTAALAGGTGQAVRVTARRLIGYWRSERDPRWPEPRDFVDPDWDAEEREAVALYLESGASSASTLDIGVELGFSTCRICGKSNG